MSDYKAIVGIDPSLTGTAVCVAGSDPVRLTSPANGTGIGERTQRYIELVKRVEMVVPRGATVFIEGYGFCGKGNSGRWLAEYGGILRSRLIGLCVLVEVTPNLLKKFATGKFTCEKEVVRAFVAKRWGVIHDSSDETDAFVLAQIGLCYAGQVEPDNQAQREVIETLKTGGVKRKKKAKSR